MRTSAIAIILLIITNMGFGNYRLQQEKDTATHQQDEIDTSNDWAPILYEHPSALLIGTTALIACIIFSKIYFTQTLLPHAGIAGGALKKTKIAEAILRAGNAGGILTQEQIEAAAMAAMAAMAAIENRTNQLLMQQSIGNAMLGGILIRY